MEHVRSVGESLISAVNTFVAEHRISEAEGSWEDDLPRNIAEGSQEFHRSLSESWKRVADIYFGRDDKEAGTTQSLIKIEEGP